MSLFQTSWLFSLNGNNMHRLFEQVLEKKDLSKAGDLFSLDDSLIVDELSTVLNTIQEISNKPEFLTSHNDQSLVEICVTRVISAIRETGSIEKHSQALICLLESCLSHSLKPTGRGDPPHAKMASDIMSCIFLNYSKRAVMIRAIPVAVKFLHKGNKDLSRNLSSYMSLAVIENADILSLYIQPVLDSVITGNFSLSRVLPAIYAVDKQLINNHVMTLVSLLSNCSDTENMALLNLFGLVAKDSPGLLEPSIPQLCDCLAQQSRGLATLQVLQDIAAVRPACLVDHIVYFKQTAKSFPKTTVSVLQLMSAVCRTSLEKSRATLDYICDMVSSIETEKHNIIFKEITYIIQKFPSLLNGTLINKLSAFEDSTSLAARGIIADIKNEYNMKRIDKPLEKSDRNKLLESVKIKEREREREKEKEKQAGVTIVKVGGSKPDVSEPGRQSVARVELTSVVKHGREVELDRGFSVISSHRDGSRSTGKLPTHRSMTRLNMNTSASRLESRLGLHKSMTRLDHRYNSNNAVTVTNRSSNNISNTASFRPPSLSTYTAKTSASHGAPPVVHMVSSGSPVKTISSGSMSGLSLTERERDAAGKFTVDKSDIAQIQSDFARQSHQLSSVFSRPLPTDYSRDSSLPPVSLPLSVSSIAPLSLPTSGGYKRPGHSSGPLHTSPPSLPGPVTSSTISCSNSQPLDLKTSYDKIASREQRSTFSNTLPSLRRRSHQVTSVTSTSDGGDLFETNHNVKNRMSVFEPFPMRDTVQHFCEKHLDKIKSYMESVSVKLPLPVKCTIEERKGKKHAKLHFACQGRGDHCLYKTTFYTLKSRHPRTWIHLMFLALQSRSQSALSTRDSGVSSLKNCWEILKYEEKTFSTVVTGAFPNARDQDSIIHELGSNRFFDVFEYNAPKLQWGCFLCNHPERASTFIADEEPVIEGQLKEKKGGKWRIFKKWKNRYFTLSGARLACKEEEHSGGAGGGRITQVLDVGSIKSVKIPRNSRNIPKAFEIFTADKKKYILKANDSSTAQEWVQCLNVAFAHSQVCRYKSL